MTFAFKIRIEISDFEQHISRLTPNMCPIRAQSQNSAQSRNRFSVLVEPAILYDSDQAQRFTELKGLVEPFLYFLEAHF